jgi:hypothetical protein
MRRPRSAAAPLFAVLATWNEADIVEATVANALAQGCERVYLIDNDSDDDTVARAEAAGATHVLSYSTTDYDEGERIEHMNDVVRTISLHTDAERIWWLHLDADEFPTGRGGRTIADQLAELHPRFRVLGATFLNHFPTALPVHVPGVHPIEVQPLCDKYYLSYCFLGHHKHPLLRFDRDEAEPQLLADRGFHTTAEMSPRVAEPCQSIRIHHFPFRDEARTRARLERVNERTPAHMPSQERAQFIDAVYRGDWQAVRLRRTRLGDRPMRLVDWRELVKPSERRLFRWYGDDELRSAIAAARADRDAVTADQARVEGAEHPRQRAIRE